LFNFIVAGTATIGLHMLLPAVAVIWLGLLEDLQSHVTVRSWVVPVPSQKSGRFTVDLRSEAAVAGLLAINEAGKLGRA
jgi:hypothetical protein